MNKLWNEQEISDLIKNQIEENLNLDYKSAESLSKSSDLKKKEIAKDVSAMANSDGGVIIYGVKEYDVSDKRHLPEKIDPIDRNEISKEWLEQIINTNIFPRISNIIIEPIPAGDSPNGVIYVVTIPKSNTAHQANDKRYYKRFNFESIAMYDYEIRDILNRAQTPVINIEFLIERETYEVNSGILGMPSYINHKQEPEYHTDIELLVYAYNNGKILANYINCVLEIPEAILVKKDKRATHETFVREGIPYEKRFRKNTDRDIIGRSGSGFSSYPNYGPTRYIPVLPKTNVSLSTNSYSSILLKDAPELRDLKIYWTVYADNAEPIMGEYFYKDIEVKDKSKK
jgi:hypothetical protein